MQDGVETLLLEEARDQIAVADVALDEAIVRIAKARRDVGTLEARVVEVVEVVENDDPVAARKTPVGEVRADKARPACDEQPHEAVFARCAGVGVGVRAAFCASLYSFWMAAFWRLLISQRNSADSSTPTTRRFAASKSVG